MNNTDEQSRENIQQKIAQMEAIVKTRLDKDALSRLSNIKLAYPENFIRIIASLYRHFNTNPESGIITDNDLKSMLKHMASNQKNINIRRM